MIKKNDPVNRVILFLFGLSVILMACALGHLAWRTPSPKRYVAWAFTALFALYSPLPFVAWWYERKAVIERENRKLKIVTK